MADLSSVLDEATDAALISAETRDRLLPFLAARGVVVGSVAPDRTPSGAGLYADPDPAGVDTETPRFVRGFHDILITIGVVILIGGLWGLSTVYAVLPAIIVLSEILVRRQRLALPAVTLTIALVAWTAAFMATRGQSFWSFRAGGDVPLDFFVAFPVMLGLYYWRYRVPLAFALGVMAGFGLLLALFFQFMQQLTGDPLFPGDRPAILSGILLACAIGLFAVALYFDLGDTRRRTRRSDIAFWLHMGAAPALLYSAISLFSPGGRLFDAAEGVSARTPTVVITVALLMLIGLIIDRRAFVTSGLLSLGVAIYSIFRQGTAGVDTYLYMTLLIVGVIVLVIGIGWIPLRRLTMAALPRGLSSRLPPAA